MLVLSRRVGEKIRISDDVWITVIEIENGKIRLGIEAPREVVVTRSELLPIVVKNPVCPDCGRALAGSHHLCPKGKTS